MRLPSLCCALPGGPGMKDTSRDMEERYQTLLMQRTGEERLIAS
ncbi:hypothetical protein [Nitrospira sp. KM1]|nr:hypothetical protein [Nitrospira sp. KM1]